MIAIALVRCHYCSRERPPWRVHRLGSDARPAQTICDYCLEWHQRAIDLLSGHGISGCQACEATWETLRDREPDAEVRLYVVPRDGIYQVLCAACVQPYVKSRKDLYRGTPYGALIHA